MINSINQDIVDRFVSYLINEKYNNIVQDIQIDYCDNERGKYLKLIVVLIKKSQRNKGYGSTILSEIVQFANVHNVRIILYVCTVFGSDINRLYDFYYKHNFSLLEKDEMVYNPVNL
jgi:predicted acetyltransferase